MVLLVGDGELDEGSNHEAIAFAGAAGLDALIVVVVDNGSATYRPPGGLGGWFATAGWTVLEVDGRDHDQLRGALADRRPPVQTPTTTSAPAPTVVIARVETPGAAA